MLKPIYVATELESGANAELFSFSPVLVIIIAVLGLLVVLGFYALRSIGLFVLAKRQNINKAFIAFIPFVWIYIVCKLVGESRFFGTTISKLTLAITIIFCSFGVINVVFDFFQNIPLIGYYLHGGEITIIQTIKGEIFLDAPGINNPFNLPFINGLMGVLRYLVVFIDLFDLFIFIGLFFPLFRKFWPQHYILAAVLSFMGLFAPFAFAIRKKDPINFNDYIRTRYYGMYYGNMGGQNTQGNYNGFNNQQNNNYQNVNNPFTEFEEKQPKDPFEEFSNGNENKFKDNNND